MPSQCVALYLIKYLPHTWVVVHAENAVHDLWLSQCLFDICTLQEKLLGVFLGIIALLAACTKIQIGLMICLENPNRIETWANWAQLCKAGFPTVHIYTLSGAVYIITLPFLFGFVGENDIVFMWQGKRSDLIENDVVLCPDFRWLCAPLCGVFYGFPWFYGFPYLERVEKWQSAHVAVSNCQSQHLFRTSPTLRLHDNESPSIVRILHSVFEKLLSFAAVTTIYFLCKIIKGLFYSIVQKNSFYALVTGPVAADSWCRWKHNINDYIGNSLVFSNVSQLVFMKQFSAILPNI